MSENAQRLAQLVRQSTPPDLDHILFAAAMRQAEEANANIRGHLVKAARDAGMTSDRAEDIIRRGILKAAQS